MSAFTLRHGDCLDVLRGMESASIDAIVTDPPYGLSFMGKRWDYDVPSVEIWAECLRVLKPGGHLLAFAGTRTQHRMAVRIEDAGFDIRDMIAWVYGSGFPKSLDVSKAIDKAAGVEGGNGPMKRGGERLLRQAPEAQRDGGGTWGDEAGRSAFTYAPATDAARQWQGWGTALKPALEPITVARKPLSGTVAENVLAHGTGAMNIDGCRVATTDDCARNPALVHDTSAGFGKGVAMGGRGHDAGRWPANLIHDGGEEPAALLGDAARFFYCAKASKRDRDEGLDGFTPKARPTMGSGIGGQPDQERMNNRNHHPTVKPTALMRYLCRLVTPPGGVVLDPFMGSGSTGKAAALEGFQFVGIEKEEEYFEIAKARIAWVTGLAN
jgi:site-specific DNA-methyltransferase (adenine-specific)